MKIMLAWYPIMDAGGIINHNEQLAAGLKELGHEVHTRLFLPRDNHPRDGMAGGHGTWSPHTGLEFDQKRGYSFKKAHCIPYRGKMLPVALWIMKEFDLIIWQVAVPTKRVENRGNEEWQHLYRCGVKQLAVIHDGNFLDSYPWLSEVEDCISGLICVHHCAFNSAKHISIPSSLIPNPQEIGEPPDLSLSAWSRRKPGFLSLQTFKSWKHVEELVRAVPYTHVNYKILAGKGAGYYNMTSKDKCKWPGIWDAAIAHGMEYRGVITNEQRDDDLRKVTCLVDPSWSKKYAKIGGHFNRVLVDAIKCGALPVVRPLGISTNFDGFGELFVNGSNCIAIRQNVTPEEYGDSLTEMCHLPHSVYREIMTRAVQLLPMFDRKRIAARVIDLANGEAQQYGVTTPQVYQDSDTAHFEFFGADDEQEQS